MSYTPILSYQFYQKCAKQKNKRFVSFSCFNLTKPTILNRQLWANEFYQFSFLIIFLPNKGKQIRSKINFAES